MYKKILVAIDDSETSASALREALLIAKASNAKLYIAHVADAMLMSMHGRTFSSTLNIEHAIAEISSAGRTLLDTAAKSAEGIDAETLLLETRNRRISEILSDKAKELGVDLIIIGRHGQRGLATLILGSTAEQLAKMATASVLLVRKH
ncbi:MAG: universal stress protein [Betaproteobacteria bacterium HGW-Betaproteobacteria-10]|jgi:nucleotide-binding universal stress UspA family protein|nr:MAG: universal stress protein [Betaproteobacteria bacterium HGW-Betaproteobacteria-10]